MGRPGGGRGLCGAVGHPASGQRATAIVDHGPLTEAGRSSPFPALQRACAVVGDWRNPHRPRAGAVLRAGPRVWRTKLSVWDFLGSDPTMGP